MFSALLFTSAHAIWDISTEGDLRYTGSSEEHWVGVDGVSLVIRKVLADDRGDRWDFGLNSELSDNFSSFMLHELYANLKGPLGRWNITAGRVRLPFGLITDYSTYRYLFDANEHQTIGFESDNGLMFSGTRGRLDYGIALTQGYGMEFKSGIGHGLLTGRLGFTLGEFDDYILGISAIAGKADQSEHGHGHADEMVITKRVTAAAVDFTLYSGRAENRSEIVAGMHDDQLMIGAFSALDFALSANMSLDLAGSLVRIGDKNNDYIYTGITWNTQFLTLRGGYTYSHFGGTPHEISLQLYKLFNFTI
ncbi:hypothetical protein CHISP_3681 [Chitinispirillum alkaliphilum]|nr:hypothetical protein CHISP_3681 [Chitinispirillum alkaliphilum]